MYRHEIVKADQHLGVQDVRQSVRTVILPMFPRTVPKCCLLSAEFQRKKDRTIFIQTVINRLISANLKTCRPVVRPKHCRNRLHRATVHRNWQHRQFGVDSYDGRMFGGSKGREICRLLRF